MSQTLNASYPLPSLLTSLSNAGWGSLAGRSNAGLRTTLTALERRLPRKSAAGRVTVAQIADTAGLSERWARRCLYQLEDLGLIRWHRGMIIDGRPQPSHITVIKKRIVNLIRAARGEMTRRVAERNRAFNERLSQLRNRTLPPNRRKKVTPRAELSADLTTLKSEERSERSSLATAAIPPHREDTNMYEAPPSPRDWRMPKYCDHVGSSDRKVIYSCPDCRLSATDKHELEAWKMKRRREQTHVTTHLTLDEEAHKQMLDTRYPGLSIVEQTRRYLADTLRSKR